LTVNMLPITLPFWCKKTKLNTVRIFEVILDQYIYIGNPPPSPTVTSPLQHCMWHSLDAQKNDLQLPRTSNQTLAITTEGRTLHRTSLHFIPNRGPCSPTFDLYDVCMSHSCTKEQLPPPSHFLPNTRDHNWRSYRYVAS